MRKRYLIILLTLLSFSVNSQYLWRIQSSGTAQDLNKIHSHSIAGNNGTYLSNDYNGWSQINLGYTNDFNDINSGYIVGDNGLILKTTTGGSWVQIPSNTNSDLNSIFRWGNRIYIAGNNGTIIRSINSGANWSLQYLTSKNLNSIQCSFYNAAAAGDSGTIFKTTNTGLNWFSIPFNSQSKINQVKCYGVNFDTILVCGNNGLFNLTTNNGQNWQQINTGHNINYKSFYYKNFNDNNIWLTAENGYILYSSNRGVTWKIDHIASSSINYLEQGQSSPEYAVGNNGLILYRDIYYYNTNFIDCNSIKAYFKNDGSFNMRPITNQLGFEWPKGSNKYARYASGLWIGAKVDDDTLIAVAHYAGEYVPGYTDNNGNYQGRNDTNYRIYKIDHNISSWDRSKWPNALLGNSDQGAPVYFDEAQGIYKPLDMGSQTMFMRFTDSDSTVSYRRTDPLKADIIMTNFANAGSGPLSQVILTEYRIINRSNKVWQNAYIAVWTDDDIGGISDELAGTDTTLALGYQYNADNYDEVYGFAPPAVGNVLLKGAVVYTGNPNDTVYYCEGKQKKYRVGYKDLGMTVFNAGDNDTGYDPAYYFQYYRMLEGKLSDGSYRINPFTNQPAKIVYTGDPVTGTGWLSTVIDEWRYHQSTGPVNMNPGDTQTIVFAQVIARGNTNINSITVLREYAQAVRDYYNSCYTNVPIGIEPISQNIPDRFELYQNYPNPFNPKTILRFALQEGRGQMTEVRLVIYNALGQVVETLVNEELNAGIYEVEFNGSNLASGVYYYSLIVGSETIQTRKMVLLK